MTHDLLHQDTPDQLHIPTEIDKTKKKKRRKETGLSWIDDPHCAVKGETGLWIAVITQAMVDALSKSKNPELVYHKDKAIRWLTDNNKDFIQVCLLADLDPDYIRRKAKKAIVSPAEWRAAPGFGKRYMERKIYRQKNKSAKTKKDSPTAIISSPPNHENEYKVIQGPWQTTNA